MSQKSPADLLKEQLEMQGLDMTLHIEARRDAREVRQDEREKRREEREERFVMRSYYFSITSLTFAFFALGITVLNFAFPRTHSVSIVSDVNVVSNKKAAQDVSNEINAACDPGNISHHEVDAGSDNPCVNGTNHYTDTDNNRTNAESR